MLKVSKNREHSLVLTKLHHYYNLRLHSRRIGSAGSCIGVHWGVQGLHWACSLGAFMYIFSLSFLFLCFPLPYAWALQWPDRRGLSERRHAGTPASRPVGRCSPAVHELVARAAPASSLFFVLARKALTIFL